MSKIKQSLDLLECYIMAYQDNYNNEKTLLAEAREELKSLLLFNKTGDKCK